MREQDHREASAPLSGEAVTANAEDEHALTRRVALTLRSVAAELDQVHPETDTPSDRRDRTSGCLQKLKESEQVLSEMAQRTVRAL